VLLVQLLQKLLLLVLFLSQKLLELSYLKL
jgi:hypothetical protein